MGIVRGKIEERRGRAAERREAEQKVEEPTLQDITATKKGQELFRQFMFTAIRREVAKTKVPLNQREQYARTQYDALMRRIEQEQLTDQDRLFIGGLVEEFNLQMARVKEMGAALTDQRMATLIAESPELQKLARTARGREGIREAVKSQLEWLAVSDPQRFDDFENQYYDFCVAQKKGEEMDRWFEIRMRAYGIDPQKQERELRKALAEPDLRKRRKMLEELVSQNWSLWDKLFHWDEMQRRVLQFERAGPRLEQVATEVEQTTQEAAKGLYLLISEQPEIRSIIDAEIARALLPRPETGPQTRETAPATGRAERATEKPLSEITGDLFRAVGEKLPESWEELTRMFKEWLLERSQKEPSKFPSFESFREMVNRGSPEAFKIVSDFVQQELIPERPKSGTKEVIQKGIYGRFLTALLMALLIE